MGRTHKIALIVISFITLATTALSVDFIVRDESGAYNYNCINTCGPVKVKKAGKCKYLVHSKYFRGLLDACTAEEAARKACGEEDFDTPVRKDLLSTSCL